MTPTARRGLIVALAQMLLVGSLGAKLLLDRVSYPRVWVPASATNPSAPIRGRYLSLRVDAAIGPGLELPGPAPVSGLAPTRPVRLVIEGSRLTALPATGSTLMARGVRRRGERVAELVTPLAYYVPGTGRDWLPRGADAIIWVEVTVPPRGGPRPIRIGVRDGEAIVPIDPGR